MKNSLLFFCLLFKSTKPSNAFKNATWLTEFIYPSGVTSIGSSAFYNCTGLSGDLIIPNNIVRIENSAFSGCTGFDGSLIIGKGVKTIESNAFYNTSNIQRIIITSGDEFIDSDYRKTIIDNLDKSKTLIDLSYNFDETSTRIETETTARAVKPILKKVVAGEELDYDNTPSKEVVLSLETPYRESDVIVLKDGKEHNLPKAIDEKHHFTEKGVYNITIETIAGAVSNISFTVDSSIVDFDYTEIEDAVEKAETTLDIEDIENARDLVNQAPEGNKKEELQNRLDNIFPNVSVSTKNATANLDVYIKSISTLTMTSDTNSITFDGFSGVEDIEQENAVTLTVKSSLPYELNAYLVNEIQNADKSKTLDKEVLKIKENSELDYKTFSDIGQTPIKLADNQPAGDPVSYGIDFKLDSNVSYETDNYKTVIKFEAKQK